MHLLKKNEQYVVVLNVWSWLVNKWMYAMYVTELVICCSAPSIYDVQKRFGRIVSGQMFMVHLVKYSPFDITFICTIDTYTYLSMDE